MKANDKERNQSMDARMDKTCREKWKSKFLGKVEIESQP
jgi:hypothetical protein